VTAERILKNVQDAYLGFDSYSDIGTVERVPPIGESSVEFKTYFVRPMKFRFEWSDWHPHWGKEHAARQSMIWSDGNHSYSWLLGEVISEPVLRALAGASGISSGAALKILRLLNPEWAGSNPVWYKMQDSRLVNEEVVDNICCSHLLGKTLKPDDTEVWIDKYDQTIRRLRINTNMTAEEHVEQWASRLADFKKWGMPTNDLPKAPFQPVKYYQEYSYRHVTINEPLSDELFAFNPSELSSR